MGSAQGLREHVALAAFAADGIHAAAVGLLAVLALLAFCLASFRTLLLGGGRGYGDWLVRLLLVTALLGAYDSVVGVILDASEALSTEFAEQAGWADYWNRVGQEFGPLFEQSETSAWDRLVGWLRGKTLTVVVTISYYLEFMVFELMKHLTAVFAALLYVLGPLMIVGGLLGNGGSLVQWFSSLVQVALWPSIPPFLMLIIVGTSGNAIDTGNVSYIIAQNFILVFLGLLTPALVMFVMGKGGVGLFAAGAMALGGRMAGSGARMARDRWRSRRRGGRGQGTAPMASGSESGAWRAAEDWIKSRRTDDRLGRLPPIGGGERNGGSL